MYKKFVMIALSLMMPWFFIESGEQSPQDRLENIQSGFIVSVGKFESIYVTYRHDSSCAYIYSHNKLDNSYSGCKHAAYSSGRGISLSNNGFRSFDIPVSEETFHAIKNIVENNF